MRGRQYKNIQAKMRFSEYLGRSLLDFSKTGEYATLKRKLNCGKHNFKEAPAKQTINYLQKQLIRRRF